MIASAGAANAASPLVEQCVNPSTGTIWNTEFCKCLGLVKNRATDEWIIAGTKDPSCVRNDDAGIVGTSLDENGATSDWPGWGFGDQKHNHAGPPDGPPGQSAAGPPGLRD